MTRSYQRVKLLATSMFFAVSGLMASAVQAQTQAPTAAATPQHGGTLILAENADIKGFDPAVYPDFSTVRVLGLVYETLVNVDPNLKVVPGLAESWSFSSDGLQLTLNLRKGVKFQNGDPFTSADVKYNIQRIQDPATKALVSSNFASVKSVDTPDANTVVLTLSTANVSILTAFADTNAAMVSAKSAGVDLTDPKNANGTGPFKVQSWQPNQKLELVANPSYWDTGLPYLDGVEIRVIPDESSILAALRAGQINFGILGDPTVATLIKPDSGLTVIRTAALAYHALQLNSTHKPFDNQKVRQALSCAIDRQQVIDTAALGEGQVTGPNTVPLYRTPLDQLACYKPDLAKAKQLLSDAGLSSGFTFTIIAATDEPVTAVNEAQNIADQLGKIGVTVKIEKMDINAYVKRWLAADFDAAIALNGGRADPHLMFVRYWTSTGNLNKVAAYSDSTLDTDIANGLKETDPQKRIGIYQDFEKHLVDESPWIWIYSGYQYRAYQPKVNGYAQSPLDTIFYLRQTWLSK